MRYEKTVEEYVEVIDDLLEDNPVARVKDIAAARGVTLPTVSSAMDKLQELGLAKHERYGFVTLTEAGKTLAAELDTIHRTFRKLFVEVLGVQEETAEKDACNLEHYISPGTQEALMRFLVYLEHCPRGSEKMLKLYHDCFLFTNQLENCGECSARVLKEIEAQIKVKSTH